MFENNTSTKAGSEIVDSLVEYLEKNEFMSQDQFAKLGSKIAEKHGVDLNTTFEDIINSGHFTIRNNMLVLKRLN